MVSALVSQLLFPHRHSPDPPIIPPPSCSPFGHNPIHHTYLYFYYQQRRRRVDYCRLLHPLSTQFAAFDWLFDWPFGQRWGNREHKCRMGNRERISSHPPSPPPPLSQLPPPLPRLLNHLTTFSRTSSPPPLFAISCFADRRGGDGITKRKKRMKTTMKTRAGKRWKIERKEFGDEGLWRMRTLDSPGFAWLFRTKRTIVWSTPFGGGKAAW